MTHNSEKEDYINELKGLATALEFTPAIHRVKMSNIHQICDSLPREELVMNLCDGSDIDGVPGPSVAAYLEKLTHPNVIGCDSLFIENTTTKNGMKEIFRQHLVSTPPGFPATRETDIAKEVDSWGMTYPLFVKISDSYGSVGLDDNSVCHDLEGLLAKCEELLKEFPNLTVEEFIDGQEYSILVSGNSRDENQTVIVYPPAERAFNKDLPRFKRFISFVRNWDEAQYAHQYAPVEDANDYNALQDLARRAYVSVSGNCYGRVDVRKRDVSGKFYVLEVNASCGLGKGSSSEFILNLAGQTTQDFFQILLANALKPSIEPSLSQTQLDLVAEPEELAEADDVVATSLPLIPPVIEEKVNKLIHHPSLATVPSPVMHVIVSAVLVDAESGIPDPEGKLALSYGKDVEYVSELEGIIRLIGFDPIVHLYHVDEVEKILSELNKESDLVFNACLGKDGLEVAEVMRKEGFKLTVGLNAQFFEESRNRRIVRDNLSKSRLPIPKGLVVKIEAGKVEANIANVEKAMVEQEFSFPVYAKPAIAQRQQEGIHSGRKIDSAEELRALFEGVVVDLPDELEWVVEEFVGGREFRVLVAGDARDPNADVIVFPPGAFDPKVVKSKSSGDLRAAVTASREGLDTGSATNEPVPTTGTETTNTNQTTSSFLQSLRRLSQNVLPKRSAATAANQQLSYSAMKVPQDLMLQMDIQDLARRAFVAVHGSCYGLVDVIKRDDEADESGYGGASGGGLVVLGVSGDVRFGENARAGTLLRLAGQDAGALWGWLVKRPVAA
ncbi:hypothetical protein HK097_006792 [Rhizophlyctis rosea]|uniref:ATP-grasp domain-containing protein n=1 Tax=Rhizophlyctis rosea TaxID=64517 RepID=A0AAD5X8T4_9FUNG|nr:hypothetical protein HK097_006792 [Rhizophlyctis rosea]